MPSFGEKQANRQKTTQKQPEPGLSVRLHILFAAVLQVRNNPLRNLRCLEAFHSVVQA